MNIWKRARGSSGSSGRDAAPKRRPVTGAYFTPIRTLDGVLHVGCFISTSDANIVIRRHTGEQTFTKDQIRKVSVRKRGRLRNIGRWSRHDHRR